MNFKEDKFFVTNIDTYREDIPRDGGVHYIYISSCVDDVWELDDSDIDLEDGEVYIREVNKTGSGGSLCAEIETVEKLIENGDIKSLDDFIESSD
jgi:hypothetical protein